MAHEHCTDMSREIVTRFNDVSGNDLLSRVPDDLLRFASSIAEPVAVAAHRSDNMSTGDVLACCDLVRDNLKTLYEQSSWGWDEVRKRGEMEDPDARFFLLKGTTGTSPASPSLCAFASFRVEEDGGEAVLYCYEVQVHSALRGKRVGTGLMRLMEHVALSHGVHKAMLTVFTANERAVRFYHGLGYARDPSSPRDRMLRGRLISADYAVLSKSLV